MPSRGKRTPRPSTVVPEEPLALGSLLPVYIEQLQVRNYSARYIDGNDWILRQFIDWCGERAISRASDVTKPIVDRYQRYLYHYRTAKGLPLSFRTQHQHLLALRMFFRWITRNNFILFNPASEIELPKLEQRLPRYVLTASEADAVLAQSDIKTPIGVRDRAILEILYSTGIRRSELTRLCMHDLDPERGTLMIRQGKGKKDRMVPIGERAIAWTLSYLRDVRASLVSIPDDGTLFLTSTGYAFSPDVLGHIVREYVKSAGTGKTGACHLFRHTCATLMLEGGADIRFIQQLLGHASLDATDIYTQVSIQKLKEIHAATHPSSKLERSAGIEKK
ncbi:MAG TPA: site-specific tyrosine recombinase XerC [Thermoanaerobaculia bacterium]|nr:site-specific tyrosine recombinase XerC [Thermoanaerobaculia bacterium]